MKIYLLPGLGYDCRIFEKLDFKGYHVECLNWIEPKPSESIHEYSKRMCNRILEENDRVILIGHSLGGIVAQEVATLRDVDKIILISSIKSRKELPLNFKIIAPTRLHYLFTKKLCTWSVRFWGKSHGFDSKELQELFKSMVGQQSNRYLQWALKSLSLWNPSKHSREVPIFHIHGSNDKTLSAKLIDLPDVLIENGSHIMLYKRVEEINEIIIDEINKVN